MIRRIFCPHNIIWTFVKWRGILWLLGSNTIEILIWSVSSDTTIQCNPFRQLRSRLRVDIALVRPTPRLVYIIYTILVYCENALSFDTGITVEVARDIVIFIILAFFSCFFRTSTWKEVFSGRKCSINFKSSFLVLRLIQVVFFTYPTIYWQYSSVRCRNLNFLSLFSCLLSFWSSVGCFEGLAFSSSLETIASMFDLNNKIYTKQISKKVKKEMNSQKFSTKTSNVVEPIQKNVK